MCIRDRGGDEQQHHPQKGDGDRQDDIEDEGEDPGLAQMCIRDRCRGAEAKEEMLVRAYFMRERVDHLLSPAVRS